MYAIHYDLYDVVIMPFAVTIFSFFFLGPLNNGKGGLGIVGIVGIVYRVPVWH